MMVARTTLFQFFRGIEMKGIGKMSMGIELVEWQCTYQVTAYFSSTFGMVPGMEISQKIKSQPMMLEQKPTRPNDAMSLLNLT